MSELTVRPIEDSEARAAHTLFRGTLHMPPTSDDQWAFVQDSFEPGRTLAAYTQGCMVGTALAWTSAVTVPGGTVCPMAAVTRVGVRSDFRRRGVFSALMREQLAEIAARGEPFAGLHASEPGIYGRFGYGVATQARTTYLDTARAELRADLPLAGEVRLIDPAEAVRSLPGLYSRMRQLRTGALMRPRPWWAVYYDRPVGLGEYLRIAVHRGAGGDDGFVVYRPTLSVDPAGGATLEVDDFQAANAAVANGLWRFLLNIDMVEQLVVRSRPVDEPLSAMLTDSRAMTKESSDAELWLRLVDVRLALACRTYGDPGPLVIEVIDRCLPRNSGRYRLAGGQVTLVDDPPQLIVDAESLAMIYLGTYRPSTLAGIGRARVADPAAAAHADRVFATVDVGWCGTYF
ncbi:GNAT family N-acetyltransferase [Streptomyces sp. SID13031]|uniref:GNAT family N-acetyltransferase n=1 Tax=Streptomyces sp. SID13031 TaxID=2706046 RepID=UPI0013C7D2C4|nr:GNAT family N-acetyltransferase [Streptomyces sp. SID13031]NEA37354.1 GNAT family N-acetyltransferase [Streptomyces sp. SID13031]